MAVPRERARIDVDGEPRIPVFTVVKNGAVLKNIFVVNEPPPPPSPGDGPGRPESAERDAEDDAAGREGRGEMLIVGRHPDCHIMLTHPSVSRFHLQIHSDRSRRQLSVVDLSSVHGTWVSEKKIEPGVAVELSEGDTLRVGGSSRVYRLHWVPLSRAYDFESPFVSALDASGADEEKEAEDLMNDEGKVEEQREDDDSLEIGCEDDDDLKSSFVLEDEEHIYQDSFHDENKGIHSPKSLLEGIETLALDDCEELPVKNQSPSQVPIPENLYASTYGEKETDAGLGSKAVDDFFRVAEYLQTEPMDTSPPFRILFDIDNQKFNEEKWSGEVGIATALVSTDEGSIRSVQNDLENCLVAEAFEDNQKFNEEKWIREVGIATELVSEDEGSIRSAHDDLENCLVAEASEDNQKFDEGKWSREVGIATEVVSAENKCMRSAHDDLENYLVAEAFEDNKKFNEGKWSREVGIATELVSEDEGSIRSAHDDLENCLVAEASEDNQKFNEEKWSREVGIAAEVVSADNECIRSAHDDLENYLVAEAFEDNQKFNEGKWSREVGIATELVSTEEGSIRSVQNDLENCLVAEAFEDNQKFNEEKWIREVGIATELVSEDEGSIGSAHDDLENCLVAEASEDNRKFDEEKWSREVGIATEVVSADNECIRSAHDDLENYLVAEAFEDNQKFNEEKWSREVGIATELVSADEGCIRSAHDDLQNCLVAEVFEESKCTLSLDSEVGDSLSHPSAPYPHSSCPEIFSEMENKQLGQDDDAEQPFDTSGSLLAEGKTRPLRKERKPFTTMLIDDARPRKGCSSAVKIPEESQNQIIHIDNQEDGDTWSHHFAKSLVDAITSSESGREILLETTDQHLNNENQMPQYGSVTGRLSESGKESSPLRQSCTKSKCSSIWSRRGKPSTVLQLQTNRRKGMTKSAATASRNKQHNQDNNENQLSGVPFFSLDGEEEEIFTPDKENLTPNTRLLKSLKKISKMEVAEARPTESFRRSSSKLSSIANICNEEDVFYSDKENQTPEGLREQKMARHASGSSSRLRRELGLKQGAKSSAFKSLNVQFSAQSTASRGATKSNLSVDGVRAMGRKVSGLSADKSHGEPNKSWIMVVDTTSFLDKESRKSLQLLQGLKGTQLAVPRIVIRELDCLKRRTSLFRRTTEVSSALQWIEDTMVNLKWWIHVQRSIEEGMSIAPTPPATPHCIFGDASETFSAATPGGSVIDIISPTTEDHILESALFYRKTNPNGQLVLLSNDISLKIKAMAEGITCETAQEFRESLVNPFSERFLWADSSPRGQTWSCLDDIVLKEKYYSRPSKKSARGEGLSGLKLILRHNSQYGQQIRSVD
ncbi:hypothetical protein BT93_H3216 [Corymbia citriodora subsp. variegata]|nr:hypothetical protein BT93_H3216 [Corymbia citriodora subsp. variegata]